MAVSVFPAKGGAPQVQKTITSSGAIDLGTIRTFYFILAGGGGGGGANASSVINAGGGGGAGGVVSGKLAMQSFYATIGAGGISSGGGTGTNGGSSSISKIGSGRGVTATGSQGNAACVVAGGGGGGGVNLAGSFAAGGTACSTAPTLSGVTTAKTVVGDSGSSGNGGGTQNTSGWFPTQMTSITYPAFEGWNNNSGGYGQYLGGSAYTTAWSTYDLLFNPWTTPNQILKPDADTFTFPMASFMTGTGSHCGAAYGGDGASAVGSFGNNGSPGMFAGGGGGGGGGTAARRGGWGGSTALVSGSTQGALAGGGYGGGGAGGTGILAAGTSGTAGNTVSGFPGTGGTGGLGGGGAGGAGGKAIAGGTSLSDGGTGGAGALILFW